MSSEQYQQLSPRSHFYRFPERDLGSCIMAPANRYMLDIGSMVLESGDIIYNEGIERIFLEILYNAGDNIEKSRREGIPDEPIHVTMTSNTIRIRNGGRPIPTGINSQSGIPVPSMIFGKLLSSGNYTRDDARRVGGQFGIGAKGANIMSIYFNVDIGNALEKKRFRQTWKNNMSVAGNPILEDYDGPSYTQITYIADFARFYDSDEQYGFATKREYTAQMLRSFAKHCADISMTANIPVYFNNRMIDCSGDDGAIKYAKLYYPSLDQYMLLRSNDSICLLASTPDQGITIPFCNGVLNESGIHVDAWRKATSKPIIDKLKRYNTKEKDVAEHISMFLLCRLSNVKYASQTKNRVTSPKPSVNVGQQLHSILEWGAVRRIEEIAKARLNAISKKSDGAKKKTVAIDKLKDANMAGTNESLSCTLFITEGDSAVTFATKSIENGNYAGAMPIKGKLLNVGTCDIEQYAANTEIATLKQALGLREGMDYSDDSTMNTLRYGRLVILSDQDVDGMHIRGLIHNFFRLKFPSLLMRGFVQVMETPLLRVKYSGRVIPFYYQREYDDWVKEVPGEEDRRRRCKVHYFKGLGSSSDEQLLDAAQIARYVTFQWDDKAEDLMSIAFDQGYENDRKEWLMTWDPNTRQGMYANQFPQDTISHFVTNQLCEFSHTNVQRSIPGIDGLKQCQRKVLAVVLHMSGSKKVSQLKGKIADDMHYRYGEEALYKTIVGMGNYYAGSNNVPLIQAGGQYGSRENGNKAAADRYISASPSPVLKYLFRSEDECIIEYNYDGDDKIEPKLFYPILPIFALNGVRGIGTGFSTDIPAHNPIDLMKHIVWWLKVKTGQISTNPNGHTITLRDGTEKHLPYESPPILAPWYRNYRGEIKKIGRDWYSVGRFEEVPSRKKTKDILVTEIPVTQTISSYKKFLNKLKEKPLMPNWTGTGKCPSYIESYKDVPSNAKYKHRGKTYIEVLPHFIVEGAVCGQLEGGYLRTLGLIEKISDTNIVLLDKDARPHQYRYDERVEGSAVACAINAYCTVRYDAYVQRRKKMISNWEEQIKHLNLKKQFIQDVIDGKISFKNKSKQQILGEISDRYPEEFLKISMLTLTLDGIAHIDKEIADLQIKCDDYRRSSPAQIWIRELGELEKHLD